MAGKENDRCADVESGKKLQRENKVGRSESVSAGRVSWGHSCEYPTGMWNAESLPKQTHRPRHRHPQWLSRAALYTHAVMYVHEYRTNETHSQNQHYFCRHLWIRRFAEATKLIRKFWDTLKLQLKTEKCVWAVCGDVFFHFCSGRNINDSKAVSFCSCDAHTQRREHSPTVSESFSACWTNMLRHTLHWSSDSLAMHTHA